MLLPGAPHRASRWHGAVGADGGAHTFPWRRRARRPSRTFGVVNDVTERRKLEAAVLGCDLRDKEFLRALRHELRNPPAAIGSPFRSSPYRSAPRPTVPRRILIVEDNADLRRGLERLLKLAGHEVGTAADGHLALALVRAIPADTMLLALGLPDREGCELARQLREEGFGHAHFIAVSGYAQDEARARVLTPGSTTTLPSPWTWMRCTHSCARQRPSRADSDASAQSDLAMAHDRSGVRAVDVSLGLLARWR